MTTPGVAYTNIYKQDLQRLLAQADRRELEAKVALHEARAARSWLLAELAEADGDTSTERLHRSIAAEEESAARSTRSRG